MQKIRKVKCIDCCAVYPLRYDSCPCCGSMVSTMVEDTGEVRNEKKMRKVAEALRKCRLKQEQELDELTISEFKGD